ncbi:Hypothetical predicted protein [Pelobates cultripes]|uniref:Uncharacterized protein n=1 Tax=Pelobates cultripes TaxID=61616 RepID=A0AAD1RQX1_PELCU|nr:Hypothetical predicted protein [Pelobates cultripes]
MVTTNPPGRRDPAGRPQSPRHDPDQCPYLMEMGSEVGPPTPHQIAPTEDSSNHQAQGRLTTGQGTFAILYSDSIPAGNWKSTDWGDPHRPLLRAPNLRLMGIG